MNHQCSNGHTISGPQDRRSNGDCRQCASHNEAKYRRTLRDARQRLAAIEALIA